MASVIELHRRLSRWPAGAWLFSRLVCFKAPYFASISPLIATLESGRCVVRFADRRRVHNHLGTVHAIALCNAAELAGGLATDATIPASMRWIPKGMSVRYLKKATGRIEATATVAAIADKGSAQELHAHVEARNAAGEPVFEADIVMWVSPKPAKPG
jgi:acyl-coenzyme A thioesterase PaaI-like protein